MKITLSDVEIFFKRHKFTKEPWRIDSGSISNDPELMVKTHILTLKTYPKNKTFIPYWDRLLKYYNYCNDI